MVQTGVGIIVMAAGLGKRMRSETPKVLHQIGGKPLIFHVLSQIQTAFMGSKVSVAVIVGQGRAQVESAIEGEPLLKSLSITFIHQKNPQGTGHAVKVAMESAWGGAQVKAGSFVLVLPGDLPLIPASLIQHMSLPLGKADALRLLTCNLPDPTGYGRIVRRGKGGPVIRIVEQKDASAREKLLTECAASIYLFRSEFLKTALTRLSNHNAQKEYYLTDLVQHASKSRKKTDVLVWSQPEDLRGVNDLWEIGIASKALNARWVKKWALIGVRFLDPGSVHLDFEVQLEEGVVVHPGVILQGKTQVQAGCVIGPHCVIKDSQIGQKAVIKVGTVAESSTIGAGSSIGPYAHFRPGSKVAADCKIGNFVELKNAQIGESTNIAHLSYLGDAQVGARVNIGCGFVTCNFDGRQIKGQRKHRSIIGNDVFMGSDCQVIAPIEIGDGAYIASGSTLSEDVPPGALAIARSKQVNKRGYASKLRPQAKLTQEDPCVES